jgi:hypothetical protein
MLHADIKRLTNALAVVLVAVTAVVAGVRSW